MHDLRLVGVHEDGQHLLLADSDGGRYRLPLDEPLRAAARRDRARLGQLQIEIDGGLRPRDVQAMIRAGASAEDVAHRCGWSVEKVRRYEGPILAEREHVARMARAVRLRGRTAPSGRPAPTLEARVHQRLAGRGVEADTAAWDAARNQEGEWSVVLSFTAGGRERQARWSFDPSARAVTAADDEARWLSEEDSSGATASPLPAPHLVAAPARAVAVYDVEAEGGIRPGDRQRPGGGGGPETTGPEPVDLMSAMRERSAARGRRSGSTRRRSATAAPGQGQPREDALPLEHIAYDPETMAPPPAAGGPHPADEAAPADDRDGVARPERTADAANGPAGCDVLPAGRRQPRRNRRPSVPSWDDVMFGSRPPE
jgi:hypothetical protein